MEPAGTGEEVVPLRPRRRGGRRGALPGRRRDRPSRRLLDARATGRAIVPPNILGAINLWEGARKAGADRVLFASSNHAIGLYRRAQPASTTTRRRGRTAATACPRPSARTSLPLRLQARRARLLHAHRLVLPEADQRAALSTWQSYDDFERLVPRG